MPSDVSQEDSIYIVCGVVIYENSLMVAVAVSKRGSLRTKTMPCSSFRIGVKTGSRQFCMKTKQRYCVDAGVKLLKNKDKVR